jgi:hypothetical protein
MAMTLIKKTDEYRIYQRGDERYAVQDGTGKPINGEEKVKILLAEELIKVTLPAEPQPEAEPEAVADEADEAAAEEVVAEDEAAEPEAAEEAPAEEPAEEPADEDEEPKAAEG